MDADKDHEALEVGEKSTSTRATPRVHVSTVRLYNGIKVCLPSQGVTVVVGGNNSGKSTLLRQIVQLISQGRQPFGQDEFRLVEDVELNRDGATSEEIVHWLETHPGAKVYEDDPSFVDIPVLGNQLHLPSLANRWGGKAQTGPLNELAPLFIHASLPLDRGSMVGGVQVRNGPEEGPSHPLHHLEDERGFLKRLNDIVQRVFRQQLTLDDSSQLIQLRLGVPAVDPPRVDEGKGEWRSALAQLRPLGAQGDGMKSMIGLLLPILTASASVVVIDEPEVFLHPPQALALGQEIGRLAKERGLQVLIATHDKSLLAGLLTSTAEMSVVRLNRSADDTTAQTLSSESVARLWDDPLLRFSNVLDGLFHSGVVIAEADRDCRFFAAALESAASNAPAGADVPAPSDVLFVPCYGKQGAVRIVNVLRSVSVPVVSVLDLDILRDQGDIKKLVVAHGGDWGPMAKDYGIAVEQINQNKEPATIEDIRKALNDVLDAQLESSADGQMSPVLRKKLQISMRTQSDPWEQVKAHGADAFKGQSRSALFRLLDDLQACGVSPVRAGELEGLARDVESSKGPAWLREAIESGAHAQKPAQDQIVHMLAALGAASSSGLSEPVTVEPSESGDHPD